MINNLICGADKDLWTEPYFSSEIPEKNCLDREQKENESRSSCRQYLPHKYFKEDREGKQQEPP